MIAQQASRLPLHVRAASAVSTQARRCAAGRECWARRQRGGVPVAAAAMNVVLTHARVSPEHGQLLRHTAAHSGSGGAEASRRRRSEWASDVVPERRTRYAEATARTETERSGLP